MSLNFIQCKIKQQLQRRRILTGAITSNAHIRVWKKKLPLLKEISSNSLLHFGWKSWSQDFKTFQACSLYPSNLNWRQFAFLTKRLVWIIQLCLSLMGGVNFFFSSCRMRSHQGKFDKTQNHHSSPSKKALASFRPLTTHVVAFSKSHRSRTQNITITAWRALPSVPLWT